MTSVTAKLDEGKTNGSARHLASTISRDRRRSTQKKLSADVMDYRIPHTEIAFGRTEIWRTSVFVVCMKVIKNMEDNALRVIALENLIDKLL